MADSMLFSTVFLIIFHINVLFVCFIQVAICSSCNDVETWAACAIGVIAGLTYLFWSWAVLKMKIDDPLDAFSGLFSLAIV